MKKTAVPAGSQDESQGDAVDRPGSPDPPPLVRGHWIAWVGPALSLIILGAVITRLTAFPLHRIDALLPASAAFWIAILAYYLAVPASEWVIFRRLWAFPAAGAPVLIRKQIGNEILLNYLGEAYLYAWARRHAEVAAAPFGAVKDVSILSAVAGNGLTLILVLAATPLFRISPIPSDNQVILFSIGFLLATSTILIFLRHRLFTLPRRELAFIFSVHVIRVIVMILLSGLLWSFLLPGHGLITWTWLAAMRQLISRLPLAPDKDVLFAGFASAFAMRDQDVVAAAALVAGVVLSLHLSLGLLLGGSDLLRMMYRPRRKRGHAHR